ncbi:helix-turn-helix domain-containing protein [Nonomuraea sp. 3N208]|uniref:helix-turn-helix domain-containing protein n=1 Tax=Nonomuraea sp. 3N208 TaxID=3457421 RepID=UPI003FCE60D2
MHTVGELLRQWRHRRRLSQLDLAIAADVSARHVSLVETGKSNPSADMILRLADQLDVPLRERNRPLLAAGFAPATSSGRSTGTQTMSRRSSEPGSRVPRWLRRSSPWMPGAGRTRAARGPMAGSCVRPLGPPRPGAGRARPAG